MAPHPELQAERAFIERAYARIDALRAAATELLASSLRQRGSTPQSLAERDVMVRTTLQRLEKLDVGTESLCFGRIDRADGDSFHIGRLAVSADDQEPLIVDWRAPVAEPFYRATGVHPMGLTRRRHFATDGRRLLGVEDELFDVDAHLEVHVDADPDAGADSEDALVVSGAGALMASLGRARSGRMRDIVATVQREQDEVIRAPLPGVLVVQGGPGTGKTAVALHRAAYLLYTHRFPLERQRVLLVGPNPLFLRYIEQVLPSLGESGVSLSTIAGLVHDTRARVDAVPEVARIKGRASMAKVVARAVRDRQRPLRDDVEIGFEGFLLRLTAASTAEIVGAARRRPGTHNARRRLVETLVSRRLLAQYQKSLQRRRRVGLVASEPDDPGEPDGSVLDERELWSKLKRLPPLAHALERVWPVLEPQELLHDLFGARPLLRLAGRGVLSEADIGALFRTRSPILEAVAWTPADLPLLDEARVLLGPRRRVVDGREEIFSYGHIVVDEAQDLTPMELRMLARRSLSGSMTVVGDIAQATGPLAPDGWADVITHLPQPRPARVVELSVNYRTPGQIMALAARVLAEAAPSLRPPRSVRSTGEAPVLRAVPAGGIVAAAVAVARAELADADEGTVAVIATPATARAIAEAVVDAGLVGGRVETAGLEGRLTVIPPAMVKGLEFDSVVVVEPADLVAGSPQGLRALYVALTRATRRVTLLHEHLLPAALHDEA
ncbi:MAG: HelD family protein [Acidimicrobiales bacterium]